MSTVHKSLPSLPVVVECGRTVDRTIDFNDSKTGEKIHLIRKAVQVQFTDAEGLPTMGVAVPIRDWDLDISVFERQKVIFFVSDFNLSKDGACVLKFCGYDLSVGKTK